MAYATCQYRPVSINLSSPSWVVSSSISVRSKTKFRIYWKNWF